MFCKSLALISVISISSGVWIYHDDVWIYHDCKFNLTDSNEITAEYDLNWFHLQNDVYRVMDSLNSHYEYVFNICGYLNPIPFTNSSIIPGECLHPHTDHGPCVDITDTKGNGAPHCNVSTGGFEPTVGKVPSAIQIDTRDANSTQCYWLGMEVSKSDDLPEYNIELLDFDDAGKGVIFTILNGEWCASVGRNRQLRIELVCPDDPRIEFSPRHDQLHIEEALVREIDACVYQLSIYSPYACPNRCVSRSGSAFAICGTHGICAADPYGHGQDRYPNGTVRCLCDDGFTGSMCDQPYSEIPTTTTTPTTTVATGATTSAFDCTKTLKMVKENVTFEGTFDLCDFVIGEESQYGWYTAHDTPQYGSDADNYMFYFNIASNVVRPPPDPGCVNYNLTWRLNHQLHIGYCKNIAWKGLANATCLNGMHGIVPITTMGAAYQAKEGETNTDKCTCWRLHDGVTPPVWEFLDPDDPAKGIQLTYVNGDWCSYFGKNREFKIQFECANEVHNMVDYAQTQTVFEPDGEGCSYELVMKTYRGCPTECPVNNDELCSGHGVCDYDWQRGKAKCFCYLGWDGPDCRDVAQPMPTSDPSKPTAVLSVVPSKPSSIPPTRSPSKHPNPTTKPTNGSEFGMMSTINDEMVDTKTKTDSQSSFVEDVLIGSGAFVCCVLLCCVVFGYLHCKKHKQMQRELDHLRAQNDVELPETRTKPKRTQFTKKSKNKMKYEKLTD